VAPVIAVAVVAAVLGVALGAGVAALVLRPRDRAAAGDPAVEAAATSSAPRWSHVVDRLSLGVVVSGAAGEVLYRNLAARSLQGTHMGVLVGDAVERLLEAARGGEETGESLELYGPPRVAVVVRARPLEGGGAVATIEDVSERRRVDAVRTDFVANISHELKTPVGALSVLAEAMADEDDLDVVHRVAGRMIDEAMRVARTIDDLLELSRIELGEQPVRDVIDVLEVVEGAIDRSQALAESRGTRVEVLERSAGLRVRGDRRQLVSALGNLVENAVKYSDPGASVQVRVRADGDQVELMVADHGIGIPPQEQDRIFERFYRVDKGRSRDTGGTGLGLAIVRHVATNHDGVVEVSSQEGEGSTFVLRLPLALVASPVDQEATIP
jgi:two-component system sensor histidine kinase SenX3